MAAYVLVDVGLGDQSDADAFNRYAEQTDELLKEAGARVIAYDPAPRVLEGSWSPRVVVIQEYPDMKTVERVQHSEAYAPLKALRRRIADTNVVVVRGA